MGKCCSACCQGKAVSLIADTLQAGLLHYRGEALDQSQSYEADREESGSLSLQAYDAYAIRYNVIDYYRRALGHRAMATAANQASVNRD